MAKCDICNDSGWIYDHVQDDTGTRCFCQSGKTAKHPDTPPFEYLAKCGRCDYIAPITAHPVVRFVATEGLKVLMHWTCPKCKNGCDLPRV